MSSHALHVVTVTIHQMKWTRAAWVSWQFWLTADQHQSAAWEAFSEKNEFSSPCVCLILWPHSDPSSPGPPDAGLAWLVFVGVWGHSVVDAEVKRASGTDAVIGHVAPLGVAVVGFTDSGQGSSSQIKDWPKLNGLEGTWPHLLTWLRALVFDVMESLTFLIFFYIVIID